jgi:hypothetical protein
VDARITLSSAQQLSRGSGNPCRSADRAVDLPTVSGKAAMTTTDRRQAHGRPLLASFATRQRMRGCRAPSPGKADNITTRHYSCRHTPSSIHRPSAVRSFRLSHVARPTSLIAQRYRGAFQKSFPTPWSAHGASTGVIRPDS